MLPNGFEIIEAGIATPRPGRRSFRSTGTSVPTRSDGSSRTREPACSSPTSIWPKQPARHSLTPPDCELFSSGTTRRTATSRSSRGAPAGDPDVEARSSLSYRFYTSGTTGRPRGVERDNAVDDRTGASTRRVLQMWGMIAADVFLATGPIYHAAGSYAFLSLHAGSTVSVLPKFDGQSWLQAVDRHRVTVTLMVPAHFIRVLEVPEDEWEKFDLSSLRLVLACRGTVPDLGQAADHGCAAERRDLGVLRCQRGRGEPDLTRRMARAPGQRRPTLAGGRGDDPR